MSGATPYETFCALGIPPFTTYDEWSEAPLQLRLRAMPHAFPAAAFAGEAFRYGAFLGWRWEDAISPRFVAVASAMAPEALAATGLLATDHQCGGHSCWAVFYVARPVAISKTMQPDVAALCQDYCHAHGGWFMSKPSEAVREFFHEEVAHYRARWAAAGISTNAALGPDGKALMEGVYPLDASPENLSRFLADADAELRALGPLAADPVLRSQLILVTLADNSD